MNNPQDKIFYCASGESLRNYSIIASRIIKEIGLTPFVYENIELNAKSSNLDKEIRDDFYESKIAIIVLGMQKGGKEIGNNWAIPELSSAISIGIKCFVYILAKITKKEIEVLNLPLDPIIITDERDFESKLERDLLSYLEG